MIQLVTHDGVRSNGLTQRKNREVTKARGTRDWRKLRSAALLVRLSLELKSDCRRPRRKKTPSIIAETPPDFQRSNREGSYLRGEFQCRAIFAEGIYVSEVDCDLRQRDRVGSRSSATSGGREGVIFAEDQNDQSPRLAANMKGAVGIRRTTHTRGQAGIRLWKRRSSRFGPHRKREGGRVFRK